MSRRTPPLRSLVVESEDLQRISPGSEHGLADYRQRFVFVPVGYLV